MIRAASKVMEWCALVTWAAIVGGAAMYFVLYALSVIYSGPHHPALQKLPDRFLSEPARRTA